MESKTVGVPNCTKYQLLHNNTLNMYTILVYLHREFGTLLPLPNNSLPCIYSHKSGSCLVQLVPFCWPRSSKMPRLRIVMWFTPWLRQTPLFFCLPLHCSRSPSLGKGAISHPILFCSTARNTGQCYERLFQRAQVAFIENCLFSEMYSQSLPQSLLCALNHAF